MFGISCFGALIAGLYGIVHDQVTYAISPEYFTRLKFTQFHWADFGLPIHFFVAEIGFLATWWVGFLAGWVLTRVMVSAPQPQQMFTPSLRGFTLTIGSAITAAIIAYVVGTFARPQAGNSDLADLAASLGVRDVAAFVRVTYIHNAGYIGALIGITFAAVATWRRTRVA